MITLEVSSMLCHVLGVVENIILFLKDRLVAVLYIFIQQLINECIGLCLADDLIFKNKI